jgi:hypothetical protein
MINYTRGSITSICLRKLTNKLQVGVACCNFRIAIGDKKPRSEIRILLENKQLKNGSSFHNHCLSWCA